MEFVAVRTSEFREKRPLDTKPPLKKEHKRPAENNCTSVRVFVNHAAIAWNEGRRKWIGDANQKPKRVPKDPIISWSMAYEDLLSTNDAFAERIPLTEMVDFLVDIWHDEGLYD